MEGVILGIYPTRSSTNEKCSQENISIFFSENKRKWLIGAKANDTDVHDQYKVLMGDAIPEMASGDKLLA